nr:MAG TPA: hypothetical protein [Caudoviricetes sp.]
MLEIYGLFVKNIQIYLMEHLLINGYNRIHQSHIILMEMARQ